MFVLEQGSTRPPAHASCLHHNDREGIPMYCRNRDLTFDFDWYM